MQIIRKQIDDNQKYIRNVIIKVISESTGAKIATISILDFNDNAELLLNSIKVVKTKDGAFEIPALEGFISKLKCNTSKAKSSDKADIILVVHDSQIGSESKHGFSIKSQLGSLSTLFNALGTTNFIYGFSGHTLTELEKIHSTVL